MIMADEPKKIFHDDACLATTFEKFLLRKNLCTFGKRFVDMIISDSQIMHS